ncbi:hypothetical protein ACFLSU_04700 [Bacteroidota bacterium]
MVIGLIFAVLILVFGLSAINYSDNTKPPVKTQNKPPLLKQYEFEEKLNKLKQENTAISDSQSKYFKMTKIAKQLEKEKEQEEAIIEYEKALEFAYGEPSLKIHNFAHSIKRLIILYGKTKQKDKLKLILQTSIDKYPDFKESNDWKHRLEKLNK